METDYEHSQATKRGGRWCLANEFNVLALIKGEERFVFVYDDASRACLIDTIRDLAADPELSLTWFDALVLTKKAREQAQSAQPPRPPSKKARRSRI
jgi:hypothetical protein